MTTDSGSLIIAKKSTNVRSNVAAGAPAYVRVLGAVFPTLSRHLPAAAGALADWIFFTPWRAPRALAWPAGGTPFVVRSGGVDVRGMRWGRGPRVFLVHGWEGSGAQMGAFVAPLVEQGFEVLAWDAPGHGRSGGWRSSMIAIARSVADVARTFGAPWAAVGHSLGGASVLFAASRGLSLERVALVGAPARPASWAESMAGLLGLTRAGLAAMKGRAERRIGVRWEELDVPSLAPRVAAATLVLHDRHDKEVPPADADELAAALPHAVLRKTSGLGHRRVLRDEGVVRAVTTFLAEGERPLPWTAAGLEQELFERDRRRG